MFSLYMLCQPFATFTVVLPLYVNCLALCLKAAFNICDPSSNLWLFAIDSSVNSEVKLLFIYPLGETFDRLTNQTIWDNGQPQCSARG